MELTRLLNDSSIKNIPSNSTARGILEQLIKSIAPAFRGQLGIVVYRVNIGGEVIVSYGIAEVKTVRNLQRHTQGINERPIAVAIVSDKGEVVIQMEESAQKDLSSFYEGEAKSPAPTYHFH